MSAISPWAVTACDLIRETTDYLFTKDIKDFTVNIANCQDSIWLIIDKKGSTYAAFRMAFTPQNFLDEADLQQNDNHLIINLKSNIGKYSIDVNLIETEFPIIRYTTTFTSDTVLSIPFWPRDILVSNRKENAKTPKGTIHANQEGSRTGFAFASVNEIWSFLYHQNLSAIGDYCDQTKTSLAGTVGGTWPEFGFALPPCNENPIEAGKTYTITDAFIALSNDIPADEFEMAKLYLDLTAAIYLQLPKPDTQFHDWTVYLAKTMHDLETSHGCWSQVKGRAWLTPYVSDYTSPPEIMVQLAVLLPILEYCEWSGEDHEVAKYIIEGLDDFYDEKIKSVVRWLPAAVDRLDGSEEQKKPRVMDAWYLHHPLLNLSRMALDYKDKMAKKLFLGSVDYCIKVAQHFDYTWPVFYHLDTLEILKAETEPGKGGEKDVPGLYAHVMLQALELTGDEKYLQEAEKAVKKLVGQGLEVFYQANNTSFGAKTLLIMYQKTKNELYLNLSHLLMASIIRNCRLWNCNYGFGKSYPTFFGVFPLNNAPYTAAYEEAEVFSAFHDYLRITENVEVPASIRLLAAEFIKFLNYRALYYYPPVLPAEMIAEEAKTGEVDKNLWIAVEDLGDGWDKAGTIGQEVYGAGVAFGIVPRHCLKVPGETFLVYTDYPPVDFKTKGKTVTFKGRGSDLLTCRLAIINTDGQKLPELKVTVNKNELQGVQHKDGHLIYEIPGDQQIKLTWD